jgi:hypothetical protein
MRERSLGGLPKEREEDVESITGGWEGVQNGRGRCMALDDHNGKMPDGRRVGVKPGRPWACAGVEEQSI